MEYGILLFIASALGAGTAGGFLAAWSCHRRLLALEENLKVILLAYDDRLIQLTKIVVRQDKSEAAKVRWSGKETKDQEAASALLKLGSATDVPGHAWDPRTWGQTK
mgnify:FL=1